jgi:hypothetical protein
MDSHFEHLAADLANMVTSRPSFRVSRQISYQKLDENNRNCPDWSAKSIRLVQDIGDSRAMYNRFNDCR